MAAEHEERPGYARVGALVLTIAEDVIYVAIAALLVVLAVLVLGSSVLTLFDVRELGVQEAALEALDALLLVFIVVELLFAVKRTLTKRELVAEPFLLVGIIASIKEIVVLSVRAADEAGTDRELFTDHLTEIAVLGVLVLLLGGTAWLLRLKEREPDEGERAGRGGQAEGQDGQARGPGQASGSGQGNGSGRPGEAG